MVFVSSKIRVKPSPIHGWGVFAIEDIKAEEWLEEDPMIEVKKRWLEKDITVFSRYRFNYPSGVANPEYQMICLGWGSIYNASTTPNAYWYSIDYENDFKTFRFVALRDIKAGEEIFTSYAPEDPNLHK